MSSAGCHAVVSVVPITAILDPWPTASLPITIEFVSELTAPRAFRPMNMLLAPVVLLDPADWPINVFELPVVVRKPALPPIAVLNILEPIPFWNFKAW